MRVLVCGGRDYEDRAKIYATLDYLALQAGMIVEPPDPVVAIIHGCAAGADTLAEAWALSRGSIEVVRFKADWSKHGRAAGPIRNQQMLDEGKPDCVVAFPGGRGTADMVRRAREAGLPVLRVALRGARHGAGGRTGRSLPGLGRGDGGVGDVEGRRSDAEGEARREGVRLMATHRENATQRRGEDR